MCGITSLPFVEGFIVGDPIVVSGEVHTVGGCRSPVCSDIESK